MSDDSASLLLELDEARAALSRLIALMGDRMRQLDEQWRSSRPPDRLLAVQRLIQTGALEPETAAMIEARNERVREHLARVRTERKETSAGAAEQRHKLFLLELELQRAEQERDELIDEKDMRGALYLCGETFVRSTPFAAHEMPLKDLALHVRRQEERVTELERRAPRRGAKFKRLGPDGREQTLIRMLPALTMEGEGTS